MTKEDGIKMKEARTAAGMSQAALAEKVECVTASDISKAERGIKELSDQQMEAVGQELGITWDEQPAAAENGTLSAEEKAWLDLYRNADTGTQQMAASVLKGAQANPALTNVVSTVLKGAQSQEIMDAVKNLIMSSNVGDLINMAKGIIGVVGPGLTSTFSGIAGTFKGMSNTSTAGSETGNVSIQGGKEISGNLLLFTYLYSISVYILLLSFYFWLWRTDIKPERQETCQAA